MNTEQKMREAFERYQGVMPKGVMCSFVDFSNGWQAREALAQQPTDVVELTDEEILGHALEEFAVSTMYGQGDKKLMPISDSETLKKFARAVISVHIAKQEK